MLIRHRHETSPNQKIFVNSWSREKAGKPLPEGDAAATFDKSHAAFVQSHRVPVVLLHELLDGQEMRLVMKTQVLRQPDLFVERQDSLRRPRMDMEERTYPPEKFPGFVQRERVGSGEDASVRKFPYGRRMKARHPGPLHQMKIAKSTLALFDVRFQQIDRFSKLLVLAPPLFQFLVEIGIGVL